MTERRLPLPPAAKLRSLLRYEPDTGELYWKQRPVSMFANEAVGKAWNARLSGKKAFTAVSGGYRRGCIDNIQYAAHRIIWKMVYGTEPKYIDHIDGDRSRNVLSNLRAASALDNARNAKRPSDNKSGEIGISWHKVKKKWRAQIKGERALDLGCFDKFDDAVSARKAAEKKFGYHPNHGNR